MQNTNNKSSISKGLDAMFSASDVRITQENQSSSTTHDFFNLLEMDKIKPSKYQARKMFDVSSIQELSENIKLHGVLSPILVRPNLEEETYELIAGERRWRAAKLAGLKVVPAVIYDIDDQAIMAFGLIENIQRKDLNPIEEAEAFERLINEFQLTHEELSSKVGKSRSHITNMLRLNKLNTFVKQCLVDNEISMGHARVLVPLSNDMQTYYTKLIITKNLSVREIEKLIARVEEVSSIKEIDPLWLQSADQWAESLTRKLSTKAKVKFRPDGAGKIEISFDSPEVAEWVVKQIA